MTLKEEMNEYINNIQFDYDKEEIDNLREIMSEIDSDDLSDISGLSKQLLLRMIDDTELYSKIEQINQSSSNERNKDPFA